MLLYNVSAKQLHDDCFWVTNTYVLNYLQLASCSQVNACLAFRMYILITTRFEHHLSFVGGNSQSWNVGLIWVALLSLKMVRSVPKSGFRMSWITYWAQHFPLVCLICWLLIFLRCNAGFLVKMFSLFTGSPLFSADLGSGTPRVKHSTGVQCLCSCSTVNLRHPDQHP